MRFFVVSLLCFAACAREDDFTARSCPALTALGTTQAALSGLTAAAWEPGAQIVVCLVEPSTMDPVRLAWVRDGAELWSQVANVDFVEWADCATTPTDVSIALTQGQPRSYVGVQVREHFPSTFFNLSNYCAPTDVTCFRYQGAHEFGHVLGFQHEMNRDDAIDTSTRACDDKRGITSDTNITKFDDLSVMNYCAGKIGRLSCLDIFGAQAWYGARP